MGTRDLLCCVRWEDCTGVGVLRPHQALPETSPAAWGPSLTPLKTSSGFFSCGVPALLLGRGHPPQPGRRSACIRRIVAFRMPSWWWWYLPAANFWERTPPCQPPSLLHGFPSENTLHFHACRGFPCPARGFSCEIGSAFCVRV